LIHFGWEGFDGDQKGKLEKRKNLKKDELQVEIGREEN